MGPVLNGCSEAKTNEKLAIVKSLKESLAHSKCSSSDWKIRPFHLNTGTSQSTFLKWWLWDQMTVHVVDISFGFSWGCMLPGTQLLSYLESNSHFPWCGWACCPSPSMEALGS